jgi:hypothetical protein
MQRNDFGIFHVGLSEVHSIATSSFMMRTAILGLALSCFVAAQSQTRVFDSTVSDENRYVPDVPSSPTLMALVKVDASQTSAPSALTCSYHVTNGSERAISLFIVGDDPVTPYQLPAEPLHWGKPNPGATPAGWFETMGSTVRGGYSMGWQARTSKDLLQPGGHADFSFDLPPSETFQCSAVKWRVVFATVYPVLDFPPAALSIALANLQVATGPRMYEGDVTIQNHGPNDAILNLGTRAGNGQTLSSPLLLVGRGPDGKEYRLLFMGAPVAGRVFPIVVRLQNQSAYTVHGKWWLAPQAPAGEYAIRVEFEGVSAREAGPGGEEINRRRYWLGKLRSDEVALTVQ